MLIERRSPFSGLYHTMNLPITEEQLARYNGGELVQNVFTNLNADQREFLMTGITPEDWSATFGNNEDE